MTFWEFLLNFAETQNSAILLEVSQPWQQAGGGEDEGERETRYQVPEDCGKKRGYLSFGYVLH